MKVPQYLILVVVLFNRNGFCFSPECPVIVTISDSDSHSSICTGTSQSDAMSKWQCADLQSALIIAVELGDQITVGQQNTSNCVSIAVPPSDHLVTAPVYFGGTNLYIFGTGEMSDDVAISCNYTMDVNESRIFDLDYNYTDYTFYFNRSEVVSFEMVQFIGCPYPLRLDTIETVRILNSTFR